MDYRHDNISSFWHGWRKAICAHPWRSLLLICGTLVLVSACIFGAAFLSAKGAQLAQVEKKVEHLDTRLSQIADAIETLVIAQRIDHIEPDNSILLDYDPIPQSVSIIVGPVIHYPRPNYGY